jgi:hypothetical protein
MPLRSLSKFIQNDRPYPIISALAAGLYPLLYNYDSNFVLVKSPEQFAAYSFTFLLLPLLCILAAQKLTAAIRFIRPLNKYSVSVLNFCFFNGLLALSAFGTNKKLLLITVLIAGLLGFVLYRHYKKIVLIQLLMVLVGLSSLVPYLLRELRYDDSWQVLPDEILQAQLVNRPNIYFIQPDGYANPSELEKPPYDFDNSDFEAYLSEKGFKSYRNFRSNYSNTVTSNSATFSLKHHYYNRPYEDGKTPVRYRKIIAGDNPVIGILKNNGYRTHLLLDHSYLVINRPGMGYDYCNINYSDIPLLSRGFSKTNDLLTPLAKLIEGNGSSGNFYFVEKIRPGHIPVRKADSKGRDAERKDYLEKLGWANDWLTDIVDLIEEKDPEGLVVVMADHGGYVGWDYTAQRRIKTSDKALIRSVYTALLAIKWPGNEPPVYDSELRSGVNLFRVLFAYLSQNSDYLEQLEADESFMIVDQDTPFGVYKVIDGSNRVIFESVAP